ncbi:MULTISPECIES: TerD family protein [Spirulina sp. CCY15215]|uniref:TerD family protein n=1 Tax=Spirulina sp. CCY15215 TaxID=2767591 RepID=UPI001951F66B|nr:TerD family protein [Spirulina major]
MTINLQKGQRISLVKEAPGLTRVLCGLGWDVAPGSGGFLGLFGSTHDYDLDASVICLDSHQKLRDKSDVIYFGNLRHSSGSISHLGDNLTGEGNGDDEQIIVELPQISPNIETLVFVVNIYKCHQRKQDFGQVKNAFVRLLNMANNQEIARYNLSGAAYSGMTGMILAELYRENKGWDMKAIGEGVSVNGLEEILRSYR